MNINRLGKRYTAKVSASQHVDDMKYPDAYKAGYDCGKHGSCDTNSHFKYFESERSKATWGRGKAQGELEAQTQG